MPETTVKMPETTIKMSEDLNFVKDTKRTSTKKQRTKNLQSIGSISEQFYRKSYADYKRKLKTISAKIDNKPPRFNIDVYFKPRRLVWDAIRMREIDFENMNLLKRLNMISRLEGAVDCWQKKIKIYKTKIDDQLLQNRKIMISNAKLLKMIQQVKSQYPTAEFINDWKRKQELFHMGKKRATTTTKEGDIKGEMKRDYCMLYDPSLVHMFDSSVRSKCFFEICNRQSNEVLGTIVFELFTDIVPRTCANFEAFCHGTDGLSYKNTPFHRIVPGYWCQGGDVTKFNGTGGTSIYGDFFDDENFYLIHSGPGILSTYKTDDKDGNNSKFNLTFKRLETMDGKRIVFGKIISSFSVLCKIEEYGTRSGKPIKSIVISRCGVLSSKRDLKK